MEKEDKTLTNFIQSVQSVYGASNKNYIGSEDKDVSDEFPLGNNATGIFKPDYKISYNKTDASTNKTTVVTMNATDAWSMLWNATSDEDFEEFASILTAENWLASVEPTIAANIAANASAKDGSYSKGNAGDTWDQDGLCYVNDDDLTECTQLSDCRTPEEKQYAAEAEAARANNSQLFFPDVSYFQKSYCSFEVGATKGKCVQKIEATMKTGETNETALNGTLCRGVGGVPAGYYCDNKGTGTHLKGVGDGVVQSFIDFKKNNKDLFGELNKKSKT
jgi:hypothetical protein